MSVADKFVKWGLGLSLCALLAGCDKKQAPATAGQPAKQEAAQASSSLAPDESASAGGSGSLVLPTGFGQRTGDLDQMVKNRTIRALVIVNRIGFFYTQGKPQGIQFEALQEFEKFVNQKEKSGKLPVKVIFLPMRPDQLEAALTGGLGDMIATGIVITPQREQRVAFSTPLVKNVPQIVVSGPALGNVSGFDSMAGKAIYVNPISTYYENLKRVSEARQKAGKPALNIKAADANLNDDDLIEMVNAGLIPATVTIKNRADLWAQVLPTIKTHPEMVVASGVDLAWVMRKNNPQFKQVIDEFLTTHAAGTSFGNTLVRRYVQNTKWIRNSSSPQEIAKFNSYVQYFKKYSDEYTFDYLMMEAQGYQESLLDQDMKSHVGAVGVMQVMPKLAAANPINIANVNDADGNIHAGVKMMRHIADTYFSDPGIDPLNKTLFTFAAYNAGPNRIVRLRNKAKEDGLDPNKWFGNVELEVAKSVGQETVTYVSNIYKYYVAYKLTLEEKQAKPNVQTGN
jgi:membrane-bound lytic murein transglycosylase MltF